MVENDDLWFVGDCEINEEFDFYDNRKFYAEMGVEHWPMSFHKEK